MIGSVVLTIALACSAFTMVMYFLSYRGYRNTLNLGRIGYHLMAVLVIVGSTLLWHAILTHSYEYKYVYSYSNNSLKAGFLIASFWGGQEGSFMLWLLLTSIVGIVLQSYTSKRGDLEQRAMAVFTLATTFLLIMVSPLFKNPFAFIWEEPVFLNAKTKQIKIELTDISGRITSTLINSYVNPGSYTLDFDGSEIMSGVYIITLRIENDFYKTSLLIKN